jgi:hypothetical protein
MPKAFRIVNGSLGLWIADHGQVVIALRVLSAQYRPSKPLPFIVCLPIWSILETRVVTSDAPSCVLLAVLPRYFTRSSLNANWLPDCRRGQDANLLHNHSNASRGWARCNCSLHYHDSGTRKECSAALRCPESSLYRVKLLQRFSSALRPMVIVPATSCLLKACSGQLSTPLRLAIDMIGTA